MRFIVYKENKRNEGRTKGKLLYTENEIDAKYPTKGNSMAKAEYEELPLELDSELSALREKTDEEGNDSTSFEYDAENLLLSHFDDYSTRYVDPTEISDAYYNK